MKTQGISKKLSQAEKKRLRSLHNRKGRVREKRFIAEGVRLLEDSIRHRWLPEKVYYAGAIIGERGRRLIGRLASFDVPIRAVSALDMKQISSTETSQGVAGLFRMRQYDAGEIIKDIHRRILLLDKISDPGNAGTLIRSACAFGFDLVLMTPDSVEPFNPKVVRASAGAVLALPVMVVSISEIIKSKVRKKMLLIAGDLKGIKTEAGLKKIRAGRSFILAIGSEAAGVSDELKKYADIRLRINHDKKVESLNAAVAVSRIMKGLYDKLTGKTRR